MPEFGQPDLIQVQVETQHEVAADRADIHVTVKGSSLVTGQTALRKAREVALLVHDLQSQGVTADDIHLQGVSAEVGGGLVKSSQAAYRLRVRCSDLENLADIIGTITAQKSVHLRLIEWLYREDEASRDAWLVSAIRRANEKAAKIAAALGVTLLGVHQLAEHWSTPEEGREWFAQTLGAGDAGRVRRKAQVTAEELGLEVYHAKTVGLRVTVFYRVSGLAAVDEADV